MFSSSCSSSFSMVVRFRNAYPRSSKNRWVYSIIRCGNNVATVAAIAPELDPVTEVIGNRNNDDDPGKLRSSVSCFSLGANAVRTNNV